MTRRSVFVSGAALTLGVGTIAFLSSLVRRRDQHRCYACQREIHSSVKVVADLPVGTATFCCLACAISEQQQIHRQIRFLSVADFVSGRMVEPESAIYLAGSEVNMCHQAHQQPSAEHQPMPEAFDRCSPSILAFTNREAADSMRRQHGGEVLVFNQLRVRFSG